MNSQRRRASVKHQLSTARRSEDLPPLPLPPAPVVPARYVVTTGFVEKGGQNAKNLLTKSLFSG